MLLYQRFRTRLVILFLFAALIDILTFSTYPASAAQTRYVVKFSKVPQVTTPSLFTSLTIGPDGRLYASTLFGQVFDWAIAPDGTLVDEQMVDLIPGRIIVGLEFDPRSTSDQYILWITHNWGGVENAPNFTGVFERVLITNPGTPQETWDHQPFITGFPRSTIDHLTNSLDFGPDGALYLVQGSTSATGAPDKVWGYRPETLLSATVLRIDLAALEAQGQLPLDVQTGILEPDGTLLDENNYGLGDPRLADLYDPTAPGAPVTIYATGLRNAYDLVWHTNGQLYVPINGASAGGNVPGTPEELPPACQHRIDAAFYGAYDSPGVPTVMNVPDQRDYLARVVQFGYYGHPNPLRCEWVLNGGNPASNPDTENVESPYPVGTPPDRNWRGYAFDFGYHTSSDGIIEYRSDRFGGALRGKLIVVNYQSSNIIALEPGGPNLDIISYQTEIEGFKDYAYPLDLVEDTATGNIYVSEFGEQRIVLLRPIEDTVATETSDAAGTRLVSTITMSDSGRRSTRPISLKLVLLVQAGLAGCGAMLWGAYTLESGQRTGIQRHLVQTSILLVTLMLVMTPMLMRQASLSRIAPYMAPNVSQALRQRAVSTDDPSDSPDTTVLVGNTGEMDGSALYTGTCAICHGPDAHGLPNLGLDLVTSEFVGSMDDAELVAFLKTGRVAWDPANTTGATMPAYGGNPSLTDEQLVQIVLYLRELRR